MTTFFVIFLLLLPFWVIFACLILPLWILIHCATSSLSARAKACWIIFMLLVWPIGGLVYGFFVSKKRLFRWSAGVSFFLSLALAAALAIWFPFIFKEGEKKGSRLMFKFDRFDMSSIPQENKDKLKTALETLQGELNGKANWLFRFQRLERVMNLYDLFEFYVKDNQLIDVEYNDWMNKYNMRYLINQDALSQQMRQFKYKRF